MHLFFFLISNDIQVYNIVDYIIQVVGESGGVKSLLGEMLALMWERKIVFIFHYDLNVFLVEVLFPYIGDIIAYDPSIFCDLKTLHKLMDLI